MKEHIQQSPESYSANISWPPLGKVEVGDDIDYLFVFRKDIDYTICPIAKNIAEDNNFNSDDVKRVLSEEYDKFFSKFVDIMQWAHSPRGNFQIHLYNPKQLEEETRKKAEGTHLVSLDPLTNKDAHHLEVSREYYFSGEKLIGRIARPGSQSLKEQIEDLLPKIQNNPITLVDDDLFRGGSISNVISIFSNEGIRVNKVIPKIKVGDLLGKETLVDPVVEYFTTGKEKVLDKVNLADPRDYLFGASGLVVRLPDGENGRVPYFLPFLPTSDKTGIPQEYNKAFSMYVMKANLDFFNNINDQLNTPILLKHMNEDFLRTMHTVFGFNANTSMDQIVKWSMDNIDEIWERTKVIGTSEQLHNLGMPNDLIFIDVNGTLIQEGVDDGKLDEKALEDVKEAISILEKKGYGIGLCSDSSLEKLIELSNSLGIHGPIIAENGNIVSYANEVVVVQSLEHIPNIKDLIKGVLINTDYQESEDVGSLNFSGVHVQDPNNEWAFGANRITSVSVYAPPEAISLLQENVLLTKGMSIDIDVNNGFLSIHPNNLKENKGNTLALIKDLGHRVIMIGNGLSDWVDPETGVECGFVGNANIDDSIKGKSAYLSQKDFGNGVSDILGKIAENIPGKINILNVLTDGDINRTFLSEYQGQECVLQLESSDSNPDLSHLSPYFHSDRLNKVVVLADILIQNGIPIPHVIDFDNHSPKQWILMEKVKGINLGEVFSSLNMEEKTKVVKQMAKLLSDIHNVELRDEIREDIGVEGESREVTEEIVSLLVNNGILDSGVGLDIIEWHQKLDTTSAADRRSLIHRDFFQKNIFIDPNTLDITGVIDWGDTAHIGNTIKDAILAAKWITDSLDSEERKIIFNTFIVEYNRFTNTPINLDNVEKLVELYSIEWYLEAALFTFERNDIMQVTKQIKRLMSIIGKDYE